jgi:hypothetical protein
MGHRARSQESESRIQEDHTRGEGILECWNRYLVEFLTE